MKLYCIHNLCRVIGCYKLNSILFNNVIYQYIIYLENLILLGEYDIKNTLIPIFQLTWILFNQIQYIGLLKVKGHNLRLSRQNICNFLNLCVSKSWGGPNICWTPLVKKLGGGGPDPLAPRLSTPLVLPIIVKNIKLMFSLNYTVLQTLPLCFIYP